MNEALRMSLCDAETALKNWNVFGPMLERACAQGNGQYDMAHHYQSVMDGDALVIAVLDPGKGAVYATLLCEKYRTPGRVVFSVILCGGHEIREWIHLYPALRQIAAEKGCDQIDFRGRAGWKRLLEPYVTATAVHYVDDLRDLGGFRQAGRYEGEEAHG